MSTTSRKRRRQEAIGHMHEKLLRISGMEQAHTGEKPSAVAGWAREQVEQLKRELHMPENRERWLQENYGVYPSREP